MEKISDYFVMKQTSEELTRGWSRTGRDSEITVVFHMLTPLLSLTSLSWQVSHYASIGAAAHIVCDTAPRLFVPFDRFVFSVADGACGPAAVSQQCACGMFSFAFKAACSG